MLCLKQKFIYNENELRVDSSIPESLHGERVNKNIEIIPCSVQQLTNSSTPTQQDKRASTNENAKRFLVRLDSFHCQLEREYASESPPATFVPFVYFEISECPIEYEASTFRISALTQDHHFMGWVGQRVAVKDGCGIYKAKIPIVHSNEFASVHLHWTSHRLSYTNRLSDVDWAYNAKSLVDQHNLSDLEVREHLGEDRIDFIQNHLEAIPGMPFNFTIEKGDLELSSPGPEKLPDCSDIPVSHWTPAGVLHSGESWKFASSRCSFHDKGIDELNERMKGMRIRFLLDSHGIDYLAPAWKALVCPQSPSANDFFLHDYDCPDHNNTFVFAPRFFRAVYSDSNLKSDFDGISAALRQGLPSACKDILGLGLYNATIIGIPTWIYVYETKEGQDNIITSIESLLQNCKERFRILYKDHIVLIQTSTSVTSDPQEGLAEAWRAIHNFNIESFSASISQRLGPLVDGIIPVFDMTYAKEYFEPLSSDVHHSRKTYQNIAQVQAMSVISAMKTREIQNTLEDPRWFANFPLEYT